MTIDDIAARQPIPRNHAKWSTNFHEPQQIVERGDHHSYGPWVLVYPFFGQVTVARWWQSERGSGRTFMEPGGNPVEPTHWMKLPSKPVTR